MLWAQRKWRQKTALESARAKHEPPECHRAKKESWIKSHFSRLSEEKLVPDLCANSTSDAAQPESGSGEASTTIRMETFTTKQGGGGAALHREAFTSRQRMSGASAIRETQKESGKSPSTDEATWAAVASCTKEIDTKGRQLANSMLQRAMAHQHSGHLESRDINQEELKALEEVEIKLKGNFLTHRETTIAGANHIHTFHGHQNQQGHPSHPSHQSHLGHQSHQGHPGHPSHQSHLGHPSHQGHPGHPSHQSHLGHQSHQGHPAHPSHQSHSLSNRSH